MGYFGELKKLKEIKEIKTIVLPLLASKPLLTSELST